MRSIAIEVPASYSAALEMDLENGNTAWQDAFRQEEENAFLYGAMRSVHVHDAFIEELRQRYEQAFNQTLEPLNLLTWGPRHSKDDFNEFCNPEQIKKYRELLSHLQKITYLGHYDFHRALTHLKANDVKPRLSHLAMIRDLLRLIVTFPQATVMNQECTWMKPKQSQSQKKQATTVENNLRVVTQVLRRITSTQQTIERWTQWGRSTYCELQDSLLTELSTNDSKSHEQQE